MAKKSEAIVEEPAIYAELVGFGVRVDNVRSRWAALAAKDHQTEAGLDAIIAEEFGNGQSIVEAYKGRLKAAILGK